MLTDKYLLLRYGYYYRADAAGYTALKCEAGVYSYIDTILHSDHCSACMLYDDAPSLSPAADIGDAKRLIKIMENERNAT